MPRTASSTGTPGCGCRLPPVCRATRSATATPASLMPVATPTMPGQPKLAKRWSLPDSMTTRPASASSSPPSQSRLRARRTLPSLLRSAVVARHEHAKAASTSGAHVDGEQRGAVHPGRLGVGVDLFEIRARDLGGERGHAFLLRGRELLGGCDLLEVARQEPAHLLADEQTGGFAALGRRAVELHHPEPVHLGQLAVLHGRRPVGRLPARAGIAGKEQQQRRTDVVRRCHSHQRRAYHPRRHGGECGSLSRAGVETAWAAPVRDG